MSTMTRDEILAAVMAGKSLTGANLGYANLGYANLTGANLGYATLTRATLTGADLGPRSIVPDTGAFTAWKKLARGELCCLLVPAEARRMSSLVGRKCRVEYADVLRITDRDGRPVGECLSSYVPGGLGPMLRYVVGQRVVPDAYDDDIRVECSHGIHCFITKAEAEEYNV